MKDLILDFLNTDWYLTHKLKRELLTDKTFLRQFLESKDYHIKKLPDSSAIQELLVLRTLLCSVLKRYIKDKKISTENLHKINSYLGKMDYKKIIIKDGNLFALATLPEENNWDWFISELVVSFMDLITMEDKNRIKCCENPECGWLFYDETKSRTKRWCDNKCASLMKVRRFRAKNVKLKNK